MAKGEKKPIGKIVLAVVVILVIAGVAGSMGSKTTPSDGANNASASQDQQTAEAPEPEPFEITEEALDGSNQFSVKITGKLTNNTEDEKSYIQVSYNLYDAEGAQVGTALANTNNLKAGGVWKFEAIGTAEPSQVASWELADVSGF